MVFIRPEQEKQLAEIETKQRTKESIATVVIGGIIVAAAVTLVGGIAAIIGSLLA